MQNLSVVDSQSVARRLHDFALLALAGAVVGAATLLGTKAPVVGAMFPSAAIGFAVVFVLLRSSGAVTAEARALNVFGIQLGSIAGDYGTAAATGGLVSALDVVLMLALAVMVSAAVAVAFAVISEEPGIVAGVPALFIIEPFARITTASPTNVAIGLFVAIGVALALWWGRTYGWGQFGKPFVVWLLAGAAMMPAATMLFAGVMT